jgi:succinate-semialdehyde dehydrogenase/glutarate-semialdehyde dehydrogenase
MTVNPGRISPSTELLDELTCHAGIWVSGKGEPAFDGAMFTVVNPDTEEPICRVSDDAPVDGMRAVDAAHEALSAWGRRAPRERA